MARGVKVSPVSSTHNATHITVLANVRIMLMSRVTWLWRCGSEANNVFNNLVIKERTRSS